MVDVETHEHFDQTLDVSVSRECRDRSVEIVEAERGVVESFTCHREACDGAFGTDGKNLGRVRHVECSMSPVGDGATGGPLVLNTLGPSI